MKRLENSFAFVLKTAANIATFTNVLLDHVVSALRDEYIRKGKQPIFETLKGTISANEQAIPYAQAAHELGISENATQVAVHRLRKRYRELLRREIGQTVCESGEVDDEIRSLISAFSSK